MSEKLRLSAIIHGRIQGVGFRFFAQLRASELGLTGYVRNRWDGTVEVVAEGEEDAVRRFLGELRMGPRSAIVDRVDVRWEDYTGEFKYFQVRF